MPLPALLPLLGLMGGGGLLGGLLNRGPQTPPFVPQPGGYPGQIPGIGGPISRVPPQTSNQRPVAPNLPPWLQKVQGFAQRRLGGTGDPRMDAIKASLLQSAAPRPKGTGSFLGDIGTALSAGQQAGFAADENEMRRKLIEAQIAAAQRPAQERAEPADLRMMRELGFPLTQEGLAEYMKIKGSENPVSDQLAAIQAQLAITQRQDEIERRRREDASASEAQTRERTALGNTIKRSVKQTADIAGLVEGLEGSFLKAGLPAANWRRTGVSLLSGLGSTLGMDTSKLDADIGKFDKLKKGMSDQLINLMSTGGLGEATNAKLEQYQNALANTETSPPAIMSIQAGIAEALLEAADAQGVEIENRDQVEANIEKWRSYESAQPAGPAPIESLLDKYAPAR